MGRATILEHMGEARYRVHIHRDSPRVEALISTLQAEIVTVQDLYNGAITATNEAHGEMMVAKNSFEAGDGGIAEYLQKLAVWEGLQSAQNGRQAQIVYLQEKIDRLIAATAPREDLAWCAWYRTDLPIGATVATMESARQGSNFPNHVIYPDGRAPTEDDGQMRDIMSMTPAQCYLNYALWPGAVKWKPRYALASIVSNDIENNHATVWYFAEETAGIYRHMQTSNETLPYDNPVLPVMDYPATPSEIG